MSQKRDYYEVLGVTREVSMTEIKTAYRRQARRYHPDLNAGDAEAEIRFKEVNEAYEILSDTNKRAAYDRFGHAASQQGGAGFGGFEEGFSGLGDIFEQMFGGAQRGGPAARRRGEDIEIATHISLFEAFTGIEKKVSVRRKRRCEKCDGTGSADGEKGSHSCSGCGGRGSVRMQNGFFMIERPCPRCQGKGVEITNPCPDCRGQGLCEKSGEINLSVPAGIDEDTRIRLAGYGGEGQGDVPAGDLYVHIRIQENPRFQREGANIIMDLPLRMAQAALGDTIDVPLIDGEETQIEIMPGTQPGETIRLRGKGFSVLHSKRRGDLYLQTKIEIPKKLTAKQSELLEELEKEMGFSSEKPRPVPSFLKKTRKFFEGS